MKKSADTSQTLPFYLFAGGVFLILICKDILSNGMFLDGVIYSAVSKNLASGTGTFWNPSFTSTCLSEFHQHPPLAFGIQSIIYLLFGESRYTDKLYSLFTVVVTGYILVRIWKKLGYKYGWIPLFFWIITPTVIWASYNNLLENTLTIFTSLSVLFYLNHNESRNYFYIILSGIMLSLGFLTKGFVAFFPWTLPFFLWLFLKQKSFRRAAVDVVLIIFFTLFPLLLLILLDPVAGASLHKYIDDQVLSSLRGVITVDSRFDIIKRLLFELAPAAGLCALLLAWARLKKSMARFLKANIKKSMVFIFLGLSGVLPIMISMKQSGFYIIPAFPFFAIGAGIILYPAIDSLLVNLNFKSTAFLFFKLTGYSLLLAGIVISFYFSNNFSRDKNLITDTYIILQEIPERSVINISPGMYENWSLHAYFYRLKNVSLDPDLAHKREYLLIQNEYYSDTLNADYNQINLNAMDFKLFRKR